MVQENINPALDISTFDLPVGSAEIFNNRNKTALEIGFGEGEFLAETASIFEDWNFIGLEIKYYRYLKAVKLISRERLNNVKLLHIDAEIAVEQVFKNKTFNAVYINFPDPWPKDRHKKHRIINERFLANLKSLMKGGSCIEFTSDHFEYVSHTIDQFDANKHFVNLNKAKGYATEVKNRPVTKFERQFINEQRQIYYLTFKKLN